MTRSVCGGITGKRVRGADILGDIGAIHRKVYLARGLAPGRLKLLKHLKEHRQLRKRTHDSLARPAPRGGQYLEMVVRE